jgi:DNA-binding CsgD family transcriptional regulator
MDPRTGLRTAQFSGAGTQQTAEMARNEAVMSDVNKYRELAVAEIPAAWLSRHHPGARNSFRFNEVLVPQGLHSELRLVLRERGHVWGALALFREAGIRPFGDDDVLTVSALAGPMTAAIRAYPVRPIGRVGSAPGAGAIALAPDDSIVDATPMAQRWLDDLVPGGEDETGADDVTRVVYDAAHAARRTGDGGASTCVRTVRGHWLRVEASTAFLGAADVVVLLHPATSRQLVETVAQHHALTRREQQILGLVVDGVPGKHIARELGISLLTVNGHLRSLYRKTAATGREELIGRLG